MPKILPRIHSVQVFKDTAHESVDNLPPVMLREIQSVENVLRITV